MADLKLGKLPDRTPGRIRSGALPAGFQRVPALCHATPFGKYPRRHSIVKWRHMHYRIVSCWFRRF